MRIIHLRSLALAAATFLAGEGTVVAQEKPNDLLNNLEVRQLVSRAQPADHARLARHFYTLADQYAAEARRHVAMSQSFAGNPSRNLGSGMSVHCKQLADLNTRSSTTARELASYHEKLAAGAKAAPPPDAARLQGGAGAPQPTEKELNALASKAGSVAEHKALEEYFLTLAKRYAADADEHVVLAQTYRGTRIAQAAAIHDRLAGLARDSAKEATAAAGMHKQLADVGR